MIGTMNDKQIVAAINKYEGAQLLALFMALYSFRQNGKKVTEKYYEMVKKAQNVLTKFFRSGRLL